MKSLTPITILMCIICLAAAATWLIPAGQYNKLELVGDNFVLHQANGDSSFAATSTALEQLGVKIPLQKFTSGDIKKPIAVPNTYQQVAKAQQGPLAILQAPIKGIYDTIDIILFILVIGGFVHLLNYSGAMILGMQALLRRTKGKEYWLIALLTFLFAIGGTTFGMAEEGFVFYPILVPIFVAMGYDAILAVAVIFLGTHLGALCSVTNPFSTIIASNAVGVNWTDGMALRIVLFVVTVTALVIYIVRYANKIKNDPSLSLAKGYPMPFLAAEAKIGQTHELSTKTKLQLGIFFVAFAIMIYGVVALKWWINEMTALFLGASIVFALVSGMKEKDFIEQFIKGAAELLGVAFIVGVARGVTIVLNDGKVSDTLLHYTSGLIQGLSPLVFVILLLVLYLFLTLFISSTSGMAVLTMPIIGGIALLLHIPGNVTVNTYLFGMGIMNLLSPTSIILPSLAMVNLPYSAWLKFVRPFIAFLLAVCTSFLIIDLYF